MSFKHLRSCFFLMLANLPMRGQRRKFFIKLAGVRVLGDELFVGRNVIFDTVYPENILIENHVHITDGCVLLTHYLDTRENGVVWKNGTIHIGHNSFIGARSIIVKPCDIGENVIIGAGSVVTKDIPDNEIWAGNPARFLSKRTY